MQRGRPRRQKSLCRAAILWGLACGAICAPARGAADGDPGLCATASPGAMGGPIRTDETPLRNILERIRAGGVDVRTDLADETPILIRPGQETIEDLFAASPAGGAAIYETEDGGKVWALRRAVLASKGKPFSPASATSAEPEAAARDDAIPGNGVLPAAVGLRSRTLILSSDGTTLERESADRTVTAVLAFDRPPEASLRSTLAREGVHVRRHASGLSWYVTAPAGGLEAALRQPGVRGAILRPEDKISPRLRANADRSWAEADDGRLRLWISWLAAVDFDEAAYALARTGAEALGPGTGPMGRIEVLADRAAVGSIAALPEVLHVEEAPPPIGVGNAVAAACSGVPAIQAAPYSLNGAGVVVALRDEGSLIEHIDVQGRVINVTTRAAATHALHVAGTIAGNGSGSTLAHGMAEAAEIRAYSFYEGSILPHMVHALTNYGARVSNHSYGYLTGWEGSSTSGYHYYLNTENFGAYGTTAQEIDACARLEDVLICKAAMNQRDDAAPPAGTTHTHNGYGAYTCTHPHDGTYVGDGYYDCIPKDSCAKNSITVGATTDTDGMCTFSSWGPTDDGRIKPDIVANGSSLRSLYNTTSYALMSGTSMATPVVAGSLALLQEFHESRRPGEEMGADLAKAILLQTAKDLGRPGPDYQYGWGLLRTDRAVQLLDIDTTTGSRSRRRSLRHGETHPWPILVNPGDEELVVTIVWTDEPGDPNAAAVLVNDLDLHLTAPDGQTIWRPFILDPAQPNVAASRGINSVDNVEQVRVPTPQEGVWTAVVTGTRVLTGWQPYALVAGAPIQPGADQGLRTCFLERFDSGIPGTWTIEDGSDDGCTWSDANAGNRSSGSWAGRFAICDSLLFGRTWLDESLVSPALDCTVLQSVHLRFSHDFRYRTTGDDEIADVDVRAGGGDWVNVTRLQSSDAGTFDVDISSVADGQPGVQVRWHYYGAREDYWWGLDTVEIAAIPIDGDDDNDGVPNSVDNCPSGFNPSQQDLDGDGAGSGCDEDDDGDAMTDAWETDHGLDPEDPCDGAVDSDGDGRLNAAEFAADTDPWDALSRFDIASIDDAPAGEAVIVRFATVPGRLYTLERGDDVFDVNGNGWAPVDDPAFLEAPGDGNTWTYTDPAPAPGQGRFYRVRVGLP